MLSSSVPLMLRSPTEKLVPPLSGVVISTVAAVLVVSLVGAVLSPVPVVLERVVVTPARVVVVVVVVVTTRSVVVVVVERVVVGRTVVGAAVVESSMVVLTSAVVASELVAAELLVGPSVGCEPVVSQGCVLQLSSRNKRGHSCPPLLGAWMTKRRNRRTPPPHVLVQGHSSRLGSKP